MFYSILFIVILFSFAWGSFLNVIAYRSITDKPFFQLRSTCNFCGKIISWYDNIPIFSWIYLRGKCRNCKKTISFLYPFIEFLTALLITSLFFKIFYFNYNLLYGFFVFNTKNILYFFSYFIFFSALIIATRTDLQVMLIPQIFTAGLIPLGIIFSYFDFINISILQSIMGIVLGYGFLWLVAKIFKIFTKKEGLGKGDMELLALIGAYIGPVGVWFSLLVGSFTGLIIGSFYILLIRKKNVPIPFGPYLALGAILYFFFEKFLLSLL